MRLNEGGNVTAYNNVNGKSYSAEKISFEKISVSSFRAEFLKLFKKLNELFKKEHGEFLWEPSKLDSTILFNGSSAFVMDAENSEDEVKKFKPKVGDFDIIVPENQLKNLFLLLRKLENKRIGPFTYKGSWRQNPNAIGDQINTVFRLWLDSNNRPTDKNGVHFINAQIDFEGQEFQNSEPTEFGKFGYGSSAEDIKKYIKGLHHKYLLNAIMATVSELSDSIVVTKSSTPDNLKQVTWNKTNPAKLLTFSAAKGLRASLVPFEVNGEQLIWNGLKVYKEIASSDSKYTKDIFEIFKTAFPNGDKANIKDFWSFSGLIRLIKKYVPKETQKTILEKYTNTIIGPKAQKKEKDVEDDLKMKLVALSEIQKELNLKVPNLDSKIKIFRSRN